MSAFIVEDSTIDRIIRFLEACANSRQAPLCYLTHHVPADLTMERSQFLTDAKSQNLGLAMLAMNCRAVAGRYAEPVESTDDYTYKPGKTPTMTEALKAIDCWLYQCSEGDIAETSDLFKKFAAFRDALAGTIARNSPEYDAAPWG